MEAQISVIADITKNLESDILSDIFKGINNEADAMLFCMATTIGGMLYKAIDGT